MRKPRRLVTFRGQTKGLKEWAEELKMPVNTVAQRDSRGVPLDAPLERVKRKPIVRVPGKVATKHPFYKTWQWMRERCNNPKCKHYKDYGGRGIKVYEPWDQDFWAYAAAVEALGPRPEGGTIDRIDNDKGYEPGNIRWATNRQQKLNTSYNRLLTWDGETLPASLWADRFGVTYHQFWGRARHYKYDMAKVVESVEKLKRAG